MTEETKPNKPIKGTWATLNAETSETQERHPKIEFKINEPKIVVFTNNEPREMPSQQDDSYYYIFDCEENAQPRVIMTSAWSLLKSLKSLSPIAGKRVEILKRIVNGKQHFQVKEIK